MKLVEFLYFYLMPETAPPSSQLRTSTSATNTAVLGGRGREIAAAFNNHRRRETMNHSEWKKDTSGKTKTTEEKQVMLSKYLNNVSDLVDDLKEGGGPFGMAV